MNKQDFKYALLMNRCDQIMTDFDIVLRQNYLYYLDRIEQCNLMSERFNEIKLKFAYDFTRFSFETYHDFMLNLADNTANESFNEIEATLFVDALLLGNFKNKLWLVKEYNAIPDKNENMDRENINLTSYGNLCFIDFIINDDVKE